MGKRSFRSFIVHQSDCLRFPFLSGSKRDICNKEREGIRRFESGIFFLSNFFFGVPHFHQGSFTFGQKRSR